MAKKLTVENYVLLWFDKNRREFPENFSRFINTKKFVSNVDQYYEFLREIHGEKIFVILSKIFVENQLINELEKQSEIYSIYIYSNEQFDIENSKKIKGIYSDVQAISDALRRDLRQATNDHIFLSTFPSKDAHQFFLCSLIFKDLLLTFKSVDQPKNHLIDYARLYYSNNPIEFEILNEYQQTTDQQISPIQWYTRECFLSSMINRTMRLYDIEILAKLAFFIQNLHQQIEDLHKKSIHPEKLTVYFSQTISNDDFQRLNFNVNSLICFNNFLLATVDKELSFQFANLSPNSIFYQIEIDRSICKFPFTQLNEFDYYHDTDSYVLFSFNSIFRIKQIEYIENHICQIHLILIDQTDEQLKYLINSIEKQKHFYALGKQLFQINELIKSKHIFEYLSRNATNHNGKVHLYLARIHQKHADYTSALTHYQECFKFPSMSKLKNAIILAAIGELFEKLGHFNQAFEYFQRSIENQQQLTKIDPYIRTFFYINLGRILFKQGEIEQAKNYFQLARENSGQTHAQFSNEIDYYLKNLS